MLGMNILLDCAGCGDEAIFSVDDTDDDAVELLEGWLVTKMPKNPPHRLTTGERDSTPRWSPGGSRHRAGPPWPRRIADPERSSPWTTMP